jgi:alkanesulfonate monooxygenase SsuD/methylene tetrahydromethanopterin reductase-like flavin-dependent oxidoreductase (luciferase family)
MGFGFALFAGIAPDVIRACAREAETLGYDSFWVNHPGSIDGLASLAHAARETRRVALGVGVIPLHTRGPAAIVESVKAQALALDRLLLGVGSPNPGSLGRVREGVTALRADLTTRVVVAALGPKMCALAGEVADGVLFNWLTPAYARKATEWVREGAKKAGRTPPRTYAYVRLAVGAGAQGRLQEESDRYAAIPAYAAHFERMKTKPIETAVFASAPEGVRGAVAAWAGAVDEVVFRAITAKDTVDDNLALVRAAAPAKAR